MQVQVASPRGLALEADSHVGRAAGARIRLPPRPGDSPGAPFVFLCPSPAAQAAPIAWWRAAPLASTGQSEWDPCLSGSPTQIRSSRFRPIPEN